MFSLADSILKENMSLITQHLQTGISVNQLDEYEFTPLIEACIINNLAIAKLLIEYGADVSLAGGTGGTALHWAAENNNIELAKLLLSHGADPNAYTFAGHPVLVMPLLRQHHPLKKLLLRAGADLQFAQDFINAKLLGHMFELVGTVSIVDPKNRFVELDFEGFYLEFSLGIIADSLNEFKNHFAARQLRRYAPLIQTIIQVINQGAQLIKYQQYQIDIKKYHTEINNLLTSEPILIPIGYEGHAITFIKFGDILVKCDRREDSRLYDNVMFYRIGNLSKLTKKLIKNLIYQRQSGDFINEELHSLLDLQPITELKVAAQVSGNCSWANVEACIPALFFLLISANEKDSQYLPRYKSLALNLFHQWREWNKNRSLQFCIQSFWQADSVRKACKAEILAAILFQTCHEENASEKERIEAILSVLTTPQYQYMLQNYIKVYCYQDQSEKGKDFLKMLKKHEII